MPRRLVPLFTFVAITAPSCGCGTVANMVWFSPEEGGKRVFGGVRADLAPLREVAAAYTAPPDTENPLPQIETRLLYSCLDLPLSAVADTVTLPYTIPCAIARLWKDRTQATKPLGVGEPDPKRLP